MTSRLLATTKFTVPVLPSRYVARDRLHAALDDAAALPLTVVVGVPGAGKSVALTSWVRDRPELKAVWLSCDTRDSDPVTFWHALVAALSNAWPDRWLDVIDLFTEEGLNLDDVAIATVNGLAALGEPVVMVIDDFHFAATAAPSLVTLIEHLPASCRLVVGSRTEPQLALHRLRAHGQLREIRDPELRLTPTEVGEVLLEFDVGLSETEIELLTARTEGWMVGVQMAAVSLRRKHDRERFLVDLAKTARATTDFLGAEVLDRQPTDIRHFLLATSVLDLLDVDSCQAVTEQRNASEMLDRLRERNLFLIELDDGVYRYHQLFGDLLRQRLRAEDPDRERELHRLAAAFFLEAGDPENAIGHLLAAGDTQGAFDALRAAFAAAFYQGDGRLPVQLVAKFESGAGTIEPAHLPDVALALAASGPAGQAEPWIARATANIDRLDDGERARLDLAEAVLALRRGDALAIERALAGFHPPEDLRYDEAGYVPSLLARSRLWQGDVQGAREICEKALATARHASPQVVAMSSGLAWVACVEGQLTEADQVADDALATAASMGLDAHPIMDGALRTKGRVAFERGDLATAEALLEHAMSTSEAVRPAFAVITQLSLSRLWMADGRFGQALDGVARAREVLGADSSSPLIALCDASEGRLAVEVGDLERAEACAARMGSGNPALRLQARIDLARCDVDRASEALARCRPATLRERLDVAVLQARVAHAQRSPDFDGSLLAALDAARTERFVVAVTDDMAELRPRISLALRSGRIGSFEQAVLDRIEHDLPSAVVSDGGAGPLSDRELTVLRYLASRLTYKEIASEIFVSTNTLKTHIKRIYRKLGASSRSEAVTEARRLGLV